MTDRCIRVQEKQTSTAGTEHGRDRALFVGGVSLEDLTDEHTIVIDWLRPDEIGASLNLDYQLFPDQIQHRDCGADESICIAALTAGGGFELRTRDIGLPLASGPQFLLCLGAASPAPRYFQCVLDVLLRYWAQRAVTQPFTHIYARAPTPAGKRFANKAAFALFLLVSGQISFGLGAPLYSVNQIALRQAMTPRHLLGRVNASRRFLVFGIMPLGALLSGLLSSILGLRPTLIIGAGGLLVAFLWVLFSSIRQVQTFPHVSESV